MLSRILITLTLLASSASQAFTGSQACASCHADEFSNWQGAHHDLAMQLPTADTVLGDFDNASFSYNGFTTRFSRRGDKFVVTTDGSELPVSRTYLPALRDDGVIKRFS